MIRRAIDIVFAVAALTLLSPLMAAIALAICVDSPGGPLYRAWRAGRQGSPFRMWKFRTMVRGADRVGPPITGPRDARITRLGRFLRRAKLDELPQFVNLFSGDMTLVGPRPEALEIVARYSESECGVLDVKPGITGCVQLDAHREADSIPDSEPPADYYVNQLMHQKLSRDLEYLRTRTAWSDTRIVLGTAALMLRSLAHR